MGGHPGRRRERGQSIVELALVLSVLTLVVLGVVDMARLYGAEEGLTNATHEGAKIAAEYYSQYSGNQAGLVSLVKSQVVQEGLIDASNVTNLQVTLQNPSTPDYTGQQIVQVSMQYKFTFWGPWSLIPGFSNPLTLPAVTSAEATR